MYTLEEVAQKLDIGYGALRDRLRALNELLEPYISRGKKGKLLLNENGLYILQRMRELENAGFSIADSAQAVRRELALRGKDSEEISDSAPTTSAQAMDSLSAVWQLIEQLRQENAFLREQISLKDEQISRLLQLALPPARNQRARRWWHFWSRPEAA